MGTIYSYCTKSPHWYCPKSVVVLRVLSWLHRGHNGHDGVSDHQPHDCLLKRLFRRKSKKTSKLRITGLCAGNSHFFQPKLFQENMQKYQYILGRCLCRKAMPLRRNLIFCFQHHSYMLHVFIFKLFDSGNHVQLLFLLFFLLNESTFNLRWPEMR